MDMMHADRIIRLALEEDIGPGDVTTGFCVPGGRRISGAFVAKQDGVVCGLEAAERVFQILDAETVFEPKLRDGDAVKKGDIIATVRGRARPILTGERTALNLLQRMSGIATRTAEAAAKVSGTGARVTDTRKTSPGLRALEKYAVRVGGGYNHRFGLFDGALIKDNHIVAAGGIKKAVAAVKKFAPHTMRVEVEASSLAEVSEALEAGADIIMLDNMTNEEMAAAVGLVGRRALTEASGNMDERDLLEVAETGVDIISIGALTHSVKALDISLRFERE